MCPFFDPCMAAGFVCWLVSCLINVPAICKCILGTDLLKKLYVQELQPSTPLDGSVN